MDRFENEVDLTLNNPCTRCGIEEQCGLTCPFDCEIGGQETDCGCCDSCMHECAMGI